MKSIAPLILTFISLTLNAQCNEERARQLLPLVQGIDAQHILAFCDDTVLGMVVSVEFMHEIDTIIDGVIYRDQKIDSLDNYFVLADTLVIVKELHNFRPYGYSQERNVLIVGKWDDESSYDTGIESIYSYNVNTHTFKEQGNFMGGVSGLQVKNDFMYVRLNVKNHSSAGSKLLYVPFAIK